MRMISLLVVTLFAMSDLIHAQTNSPDTKIRLKVGNAATNSSENQAWVGGNLVVQIVGGGEGATQRLEYSDVIVSWDPTKFELVSHQPINDSRISQSLSGLSPAAVANGVNDTFTDGNAMFRVHKSLTWNGTEPAFQLIGLNGSNLTNSFGNGLYSVTLKCISPFIGQNTQISILPSVQIVGYPTAYTKTFGYTPVVDVTGGVVNKTINGVPSPSSKLDLAFESPDASVAIGDIVSVPVKVQPQNDPQRFIVADIAFTWNPQHLRLIGVDWLGNNPGVWDVQSGFPTSNNNAAVCCDLYGINEQVPPQDGTGLLFIYGQLGYNLLVVQPEILGTLKFEVIGSFASTEVSAVPQLQGNGGVQNTIVYGSSIPGLNVTGNNIPAILTSASLIGDINGNGSVGSEDMAILLAAWGQQSFKSNPADINGDGTVNSIDLSMLIANWS
jgi:hypothetical protein